MMVACLSVNTNMVVERNCGAGTLPYKVVARKFLWLYVLQKLAMLMKVMFV